MSLLVQMSYSLVYVAAKLTNLRSDTANYGKSQVGILKERKKKGTPCSTVKRVLTPSLGNITPKLLLIRFCFFSVNDVVLGICLSRKGSKNQREKKVVINKCCFSACQPRPKGVSKQTEITGKFHHHLALPLRLLSEIGLWDL